MTQELVIVNFAYACYFTVFTHGVQSAASGFSVYWQLILIFLVTERATGRKREIRYSFRVQEPDKSKIFLPLRLEWRLDQYVATDWIC